MVEMGNDWDDLIGEEFSKEYYQQLRKFLVFEYRTKEIYPDKYDIFNAIKYTPYNEVKVVILGQDPYHTPGRAHGLSFSVKEGIPKPPTLINIFKELEDDLSIQPPNHGCLESWAKSGVMLLNSVLTVRRGTAHSHKGKGWEQFTDRIIELLNAREKPMVFILWGAPAKAKRALITNPAHCILSGPHPSPLSAHNGFFGKRYFSQANDFLISKGIEPVDWNIQ